LFSGGEAAAYFALTEIVNADGFLHQ